MAVRCRNKDLRFCIRTYSSQPIHKSNIGITGLFTRFGGCNRQVAEDSYELSSLFLAIGLSFCYHLLCPIAELYAASQLYIFICGAQPVKTLTFKSRGRRHSLLAWIRTRDHVDRLT